MRAAAALWRRATGCSAAVPKRGVHRRDRMRLPAGAVGPVRCGATLVVSQFHLHHAPLAASSPRAERCSHPGAGEYPLYPPGAQIPAALTARCAGAAGTEALTICPCGQLFLTPTRRTSAASKTSPLVAQRPNTTLRPARHRIKRGAARGGSAAGRPALAAHHRRTLVVHALTSRRLLERLEQRGRAAARCHPTWRHRPGLSGRCRFAFGAGGAAEAGAAADTRAAALLTRWQLAPPARGLPASAPAPREYWRIGGFPASPPAAAARRLGLAAPGQRPSRPSAVRPRSW